MFAFGMSEKEHGADLYSNESTISLDGKGDYVANGNKYYIGNAQIAFKVASETGQWAFWVVDSRDRHYDYVKDIDAPIFGVARVGEYEMIEYPITDHDILKQGDAAFADGLSSVNIGKFQPGFASNADYPEIGIRSDAKDDSKLFRQTMVGLAKVAFPDYRRAYQGGTAQRQKVPGAGGDLQGPDGHNAAPDASLLKNMDHMLNYGKSSP